MSCMTVAYDYETSVWFQRERNRCDSELNCDVSMSFFGELFPKLKMTTILGLSFLKEGRDDFLNISDWDLNFFPSTLLFFVENFLESRADISKFTLFVSDANEGSLSHFKFSDIGNKKEFLTHGADGSLELQENGDDETMFVFAKEESFVRVDSFILVFLELQKVVVVLFCIEFGHDGI